MAVANPENSDSFYFSCVAQGCGKAAIML